MSYKQTRRLPEMKSYSSEENIRIVEFRIFRHRVSVGESMLYVTRSILILVLVNDFMHLKRKIMKDKVPGK